MRQRMMWARGPKTGEVTMLPEKSANLLRMTGHVIDAPPEHMDPPPPVEPPKRKRGRPPGTYKRRDLVAESAGEVS